MFQNAETRTAPPPANPAALAPALGVAESAHPEPLRALNILLKNLGLPVQYTVQLLDESSGTWLCTASAGGVSVEAQGRGKKTAKKNASSALLSALQDSSE